MDGNQAAANGLHLSKTNGVDLSATDHAVDVLVEAWKFTLDWTGAHPFLFFAVLVLVGVWIVSEGRTRVKMREMKLEYKTPRSSVRTIGTPKGPASTSDKGDAS